MKETDKTTRPVTGLPSFSVKLRDDVTVERPEKGRIVLWRSGLKFLDGPDDPLIECLGERWMTETAIDSLADSAPDPKAVYFVSGKLFALNLLQVACTVDGQPLFSLLPAPDWSSWSESIPAPLRRLSPRAWLRRDGAHFILEMPLSRRKCIIHDGKCLAWLMEIARGDQPQLADHRDRMAFYRALRLMDALEEDGQARGAWEFHDLLFFHHTSPGFHDDPVGATFRAGDKGPPEPLFKPCTAQSVPLPEPDVRLTEKLRAPFAEVLANRRTGRVAGKTPVTIEELGALLHVSARVQYILDDPAQPHPVSRRPSPSGGALHSLEIYLLVHRCAGLAPGAWRYDPAEHRLDTVAADDPMLRAYVKANPHITTPGSGLPHIRLVITSRFSRESWKYEKIAYRLVLQDLGCLYQTLSLTASALGLASAILGAVDARRLGAILKLEPLIEPVIGEMTLSAR